MSGHEHRDLVALFDDFRASLAPDVVGGVPDYTHTAMGRKHTELLRLQERLTRLDISAWSISEQVDYQVVRAEMNGVDFDHRVLRPWARDPGLYNIIDGIYPRLLVHHSRMLSDWPLALPLDWPRLPLSEGELATLRVKLRAIPTIFEQARGNLTEASADLARVAVRLKEKERSFVEGIAEQLAAHHPEAVVDAERALVAIDEFRDWLNQQIPLMTAPAGVGKDNYDWWLRNVLLIPYGWDELLTMIQSEYHRAVAFLRLEEHRNRDLPPFEMTSSEAQNLERQGAAAQELLEFLRDRKIITVPEDLEPLPEHRFPRTWGKSAYLRPGYRGFFEQCCDREPMTQITHTFFGHYYVRDRTIWYQDGDTRPIRGTIRLFDMHEARSEALAFGSEEIMLQLGSLVSRPRAKQITYIWMAFRTARALSDLMMHANEYTMDEGIQAFVDKLPYPWAAPDSDAVWWDIEEALRAPAHSTSYVVGKQMLLQLIADHSQQLGEAFDLRELLDEFMSGGIIPIALTRWELTGNDDEIRRLTDRDSSRSERSGRTV